MGQTETYIIVRILVAGISGLSQVGSRLVIVLSRGGSGESGNSQNNQSDLWENDTVPVRVCCIIC